MFIPSTEKETREMLGAIGAKSVDDLLKQVPSKFLYPKFDLPERGLDENEAARRMRALAAANRPVLSFTGAGAYERYCPAAVRAIAGRGEFMTAYTPYQPEASQGILQAIYEYQSSVCSLFAMDCANASMYDGASALGEAARAAVRINSRKKVLYSAGLNPEHVAVVKTYFGPAASCEFAEVPLKDGATDTAKLASMLDDSVSCVLMQNPNFFGVIEDMEAASAAAHAKGALFVASADPLSLGLLAAPGDYGADFAVGEGQSLGLPLAYGGPYLGIFTCKKEFVRQMPGRICGMTKDKDGRRGFVLTLQAREQHIRRDKAASNICSNEALCALAATVYLATLGPAGLKEAAEVNAAGAKAAFDRLTAIPGVKAKFSSPFFNEFAVTLPKDPSALREKVLKEKGIDIGFPLSGIKEGMEKDLLVCVTETKTPADIDRLAAAVKEAI